MQCSRFPNVEFAGVHARFATFDQWPVQIKQSPKELSDQGFYYTKIGDGITCYNCGWCLSGLREDTDVVESHVKARPRCLFARVVKEREKIKTLKKNTVPIQE